MNPFAVVESRFVAHGHRLLLLSLLAVIIVYPVFEGSAGMQWFLAALMAVTLLGAVRTVAHQPGPYRIALALFVIALVPQFGVLLDNSAWLEMLRGMATMLFLLWVCGLLLRDIMLRSQDVSGDLIFGAINIYLMVGLAFAMLYGLAEFIHPGSFSGSGLSANEDGSRLGFVYFSYVTLSTLGYGDITPVAPLVRTFAYIEAIFGQLYLAILVARLVGNYVTRSEQKSD